MTILLGVSSSLQHSTPQEWAAKHAALGLKCVNFPVDYTAGEDVYMAYKQAADEAGLVIAEVGVWRNTLAADPLDIPLFIKLAEQYNPEMPFIIEHLTTDEEYVASVKYVQKSLYL